MLACGSRGLESIRAWQRQPAGMQLDQDAESAHPEPEARIRERGTLGIVQGLWNLKAHSQMTYFLQQHHTSQISPKSATYWELSVQMPEPLGEICHLNQYLPLRHLH